MQNCALFELRQVKEQFVSRGEISECNSTERRLFIVALNLR